MTVLKTIFLGLIHGLTEFLPLSSSGHMAFFSNAMKIDGSSADFLEILLHIATLAAVIIYFREDIVNMFREFGKMMMTVFANLLVFISKRKGDNRYTYFKVVNTAYKKLIIMIILSMIPTTILGIIGQDLVELAGGSLWFVGICFIITAALMFLTDRHEDGTLRIKEAPYSSGILMGIAQGVSILPGLSRTGSTIAMGIFLGYNNKLAVKYSFIMSIPAIFGSVIYKFIHCKGVGFSRGMIPGYFFAMVIAGVLGYFSIKLIMKFVQKKRYIGFSVYCLAMGIASIIFSIVSLH